MPYKFNLSIGILWSTAFDKSMKTPNVYLLWLKESFWLFISSVRASLVEWLFLKRSCYEKEGYHRSGNCILGCTLSSPEV